MSSPRTRGSMNTCRTGSQGIPISRGRGVWVPAFAGTTAVAMLFELLRRVRLGLRRALVEPAVEDVLGDAVLEHLDRAASDHPAAASPHAVFHQRLAAVAGGAHHLHGF